MKSGIYKITSPNNRIYIGQSVNLSNRLKMYKGLHCHKQAKLYASLKKYGYDAHVFEIIELCEESQLNAREEFWIKHFDTFNTEHGLNLSSGGFSKRVSDETKVKISIGNTGKKRPDLSEFNRSNKGKKLSDETISVLSAVKMGHQHSEATKLKIGLKNKGQKRNEATKLKMSVSAKNKVLSTEHKAKISENMKRGIRSKKVIDNSTGNIYPSAKIASIGTGFTQDHFRAMLNGNATNKTTFCYL